ncbi:MAG: Flp pilus assembly complex ATPase component TadA [Tissierellia bacterium]|nr:Flp pilus assembly complex ATPase component TadA [Tissierellia bacterium]
MRTSSFKLGELLLYSGKITKEQLDMALEKQKKSKKKIGQILVEEGYVTDKDIVEVLEFQLGFPHVDLNKFIINPDVISLVPENIARRYDLIPIDKKGDYLIVAMADPLNIYAIDDLKLYTNSEIQPVISTSESIKKSIDKFYRQKTTEKVLKEFVESYDEDDRDKNEIQEQQEQLEVANAPIVRLINSTIQQAVDMRASDIHIEPYMEDIRIRFRIDGDLQDIMKLSKNILSALVTRIKIIGKMNIAEKRIPQDGRVEFSLNNKKIDIRISTIPTIHGEKIVLRLLDRENFLLTKDELGFTQKNLERFEKLIKQPYGMILITGPTGSGKTTTLYAILNELNRVEKNIITIEDPVEYKMEGINQIQINPKAGLTFANGIRSILRQDPDIIMVGEIRDGETAHIAVRAAITGHLVLSTLHTNDSPSSVMRLVDMGVEPYLVASAVIGVVSQRLVKKLCDNCKVEYEASYSEKLLLGKNTEENVILYKAKGCNRCNNGYLGRRAVHEIMLVDEDMRRLIIEGKSVDELRTIALNSGMTTLLDNSIHLALKGITSLEEILKANFTLG